MVAKKCHNIGDSIDGKNEMTDTKDLALPEEMTLLESAKINAEGVERQLDIARQSTSSTADTSTLADLATAAIAQSADDDAAVAALTIAMESRPDLADEAVRAGLRAAISTALNHRSGGGLP